MFVPFDPFLLSINNFWTHTLCQELFYMLPKDTAVNETDKNPCSYPHGPKILLGETDNRAYHPQPHQKKKDKQANKQNPQNQ